MFRDLLKFILGVAAGVLLAYWGFPSTSTSDQSVAVVKLTLGNHSSNIPVKPLPCTAAAAVAVVKQAPGLPPVKITPHEGPAMAAVTDIPTSGKAARNPAQMFDVSRAELLPLLDKIQPKNLLMLRELMQSMTEKSADEIFKTEARDPTWATEFEDALTREFYAEQPFNGNGRLDEVECRATVCRVRLDPGIALSKNPGWVLGIFQGAIMSRQVPGTEKAQFKHYEVFVKRNKPDSKTTENILLDKTSGT